MTDWTGRREALNADLAAEVAADPLAALTVTSGLITDVTEHQRTAVRAAAQRYSWADIGAALGVSRQAAHQKFAKEWVSELKTELKQSNRAMKAAVKANAKDRAAEHDAKRHAIVEEFKGSRRVNKNAPKP